MDKNEMLKYAPYIAVVFAFFIQYNLFVTPAQLKDSEMTILREVSSKYVTKEVSNDLKSQLNNMQFKLDEIYKILSKKGGF